MLGGKDLTKAHIIFYNAHFIHSGGDVVKRGGITVMVVVVVMGGDDGASIGYSQGAA